MKRVRFESPLRIRDANIMNHDTECHSPRPYIDKGIKTVPFIECQDVSRVLPFVNDPIKKFECSNSSPYPTVKKIFPTNNVLYQQTPSRDLDLSLLDSTNHEPRRQPQRVFSQHNFENIEENMSSKNVVNENCTPPNILRKNNDFFLKKNSIDNVTHNPLLYEQMNTLSLDKENNPLLKKTEMMKLGTIRHNEVRNVAPNQSYVGSNSCCKCHHCIATSTPFNITQPYHDKENFNRCYYTHTPKNLPHFNCGLPEPNVCKCQNNLLSQTNTIDKKAWLLEKYEQTNKSECLDMEPQKTISKEKREPTVADLFKIIKLQNEQLQMLQDKVDKFIAANEKEKKITNTPHDNFLPQQVAVQSVQSEQHKISIGVMTSFEMVRTSTVINKGVITQNEAQIQCNRSQISIKEVISKSQPVNINFLDGISKKNESMSSLNNNEMTKNTAMEDKTLNEFSLYNVQVDNATTPQMSPEQTMYLDVKDYSDTDSDSDDPSNVGWTYYNKVMTKVNGMLQDSDIPSSASAMYRNAKQKCLMQIDKTNVSVTKRVTFGENLVQMPQPQPPTPAIASTDTSLRMNQLAAKYLSKPLPLENVPSIKPSTDMSFATKNYMERHKILKGNNAINDIPLKQHQDIPKFLDITVLKQQPKLL